MFKKLLQKLFPFMFSTKTYIAFGVEESPNKYPLNKARYLTMSSYINEECLKLGRPVKVLDIGCSEGMMILYCNKLGAKTEFYGIDILPERRVKALESGYKDVVLEDIRQFDFSKYGDGFFDVVICSHILEHLEDPGKMLDKLKKILKSNGALIVGVPIGLLIGILWRRHITPMYTPRKRTKEVLKRFGHVSFFSLPELRRLLKQHGFAMEKAQGDYFLRSRKLFLENYKWWFDFNQWYGKIFPGLWGHITVRARRV